MGSAHTSRRDGLESADAYAACPPVGPITALVKAHDDVRALQRLHSIRAAAVAKHLSGQY